MKTIGVLSLAILFLSACVVPAPTQTPTDQKNTSSIFTASPTPLLLTQTAPPVPNTILPAPTEILSIPTSVPTIALPTPNLSTILQQSCTSSAITDFTSCTATHCCKTNAECENDPECQATARCFMENGGMRGYGGISHCYKMPGASKYMQNFACRFQYCGQFMTLNQGELCLTEKCAQETAACFSNPYCFALKFCIVDKAGTFAECRQLYPEGVADFDRWSACGQETGCYALMP